MYLKASGLEWYLELEAAAVALSLAIPFVIMLPILLLLDWFCGFRRSKEYTFIASAAAGLTIGLAGEYASITQRYYSLTMVS